MNYFIIIESRQRSPCSFLLWKTAFETREVIVCKDQMNSSLSQFNSCQKKLILTFFVMDIFK